jgi:antitoxin component of RelBE/YafQ-DinJ toxin-antitoxin module
MKNAIITTIRIEETTQELVAQVCEKRSETISNFIRRAILKELARLGMLPTEQTQALGIEPRNPEGYLGEPAPT